jgi:hypothetical protein
MKGFHPREPGLLTAQQTGEEFTSGLFFLEIIERYGERGWTRTIDPCLKRALLCQLSYAPVFREVVRFYQKKIRPRI